MPLETFRGLDVPTLLAQAHTRLGEDAVVLSVRRLGTDLRADFELVAGDAVSAALAARAPRAGRHHHGPPSAPLRTGAPGSPFVLAAIGPTGSGKTTTLMKLALHPQVFGGRSAGILCLDTYRVGAVEQVRLHAAHSGLPVETAHEERDLPRALRRLRRCEVILVDTAGRGPRHARDEEATGALLARIRPAEVHLALPAGLSSAHERRTIERYRALGATHLLATKVDEAAGGGDPAALARAHGLRARWIADGQDVPGDLHGAAPGGAAAAVAHWPLIAEEGVAS